jgi:hypothetical protein
MPQKCRKLALFSSPVFYGATTLSITTLSIMTFSIMTLSVKGFKMALSINDPEHK